jgi:hypothetical protein
MSARLVVAMPAIIRDAAGIRQRINGTREGKEDLISTFNHQVDRPANRRLLFFQPTS